MGFFSIIAKERWIAGQQRAFNKAVAAKDSKVIQNILGNTVARSLSEGLNRDEYEGFKVLWENETLEPGISKRLQVAAAAGLSRDPRLPTSLSNASDEVIREARRILDETVAKIRQLQKDDSWRTKE